LDEVRRRLTADRPSRFGKAKAAALQGIGGLGKTQLAVEYADKYGDTYANGVIWLTADQDLDAQLIRLAGEARWLAPQSEHKIKLEVALHRLRSYSECLIVFDNVEDVAAIRPYLPEPRAAPHLLITSRLEQPGFEPISLSPLDSGQSLQLLIQEAERQPEGDDEEAAARAVADRLGGLPLALETAAAYLRYRKAISWRQYALTLDRDLKAALPARYLASATRHEVDLFATLKINEEVFSAAPVLRDVLDLLTFSAPASMGLSLLAHVLGVAPVDLLDPLHLGIDLRLLEQEYDSDEAPGKARYRIHRLVREVRCQEQPLGGRSEWVGVVCQRLGDWFDVRGEADLDEFGGLEEYEAEADHLRAWLEHAQRRAPAHASRLAQLLRLSSQIRGRLWEATQWSMKALDLYKTFGGDRLLEAEIKIGLSNSLFLSNPQQSRKYAEEALDLSTAALGEDHPKTADALNTLGNSNLYCGNWLRAVECVEKALTIHRRARGDDHIDVVDDLCSLGDIYLRREPQRSLEYLREAFSTLRRAAGEGHPMAAGVLGRLASAYLLLNDTKRALDHAKQALAISRKVFGDNHPATAASHLGLGIVFARQQNHELFRRHLRLGLRIHQVFLGDSSTETLKAMSSMVDALLGAGHAAEAYDLVNEWLEEMPNDHPAYQRLHKLRNKVLAASPGLRRRVEKRAQKSRDKRKGKKKR
jgi:tetratricopeptide (TPR) repeat protein